MTSAINFLIYCSFYNIREYNVTKNEKLLVFVLESLSKMAWFYSIPLSIYLHMVSIIGYFRKLKSLDYYNSEEKLNFYNHFFLKMPFSSSVQKLIRSLGFMKLYDIS